MTALGRFGLLFLLAVAGNLVMASQSEAAGTTHKINAKGAGEATGPLTTVARIIGGGLLQGTTEAEFVPGGVEGPIFSFTGVLTFYTKQGSTLTVNLTGGTLDLTTGVFKATGEVVAGTGRLANATGILFFEGVQDLTDGSFIEDVTGYISLP